MAKRASKAAPKARVVEGVAVAHGVMLQSANPDLVHRREKAMSDAIKRAMDDGIGLDSDEMRQAIRDAAASVTE